MAWGFYRSVTVDHTKCGTADSTDFPVLVAGTYTYLKTTANGGKVESANGYDIAFYSDSGLTTALKFERVSWVASSGKCEFWVKIPTLTYGSDTVFYIAYGDASISSDQQDPTNTWGSYGGVWHMQDDPSGTVYDSTSNSNDGDTHSTMSSSNLVDAKIGKGYQFTDVTDVVEMAATNTLSGYNTSYSISFWVKSNTTDSDRGIAAKGPWSDFGDWMVYANNNYINLYTANAQRTGSTTSYTDNTWHLYHITKGSSYITIYIDGNQDNQVSKVDALQKDGAKFMFGSYNHYYWNDPVGYYPDRALTGYLDEFRFIKSERDQSWVTSEWNNQNSPSTFYTLGDESTTNNLPATPTNSTPANSATNISRTPTLTASSFSDADPGDTHAASQWQVATDSGFTDIVWDSGEDVTHLTTTTVNSSNGTFGGTRSGKTRLASNTLHYWHVKYKDSAGGWSSYS